MSEGGGAVGKENKKSFLATVLHCDLHRARDYTKSDAKSARLNKYCSGTASAKLWFLPATAHLLS